MKTVIEMARSVGATAYTNRHYPDRPTHTFNVDQLERFAELVRADEREAILDLVDSYAKNNTELAAAIRARGNVATNDTSQERVDETTKQRHDTPPQRTWVGLTDEEAFQICADCGCLSEDWLTLLDAIEAKLKEKNT